MILRIPPKAIKTGFYRGKLHIFQIFIYHNSQNLKYDLYKNIFVTFFTNGLIVSTNTNFEEALKNPVISLIISVQSVKLWV